MTKMILGEVLGFIRELLAGGSPLGCVTVLGGDARVCSWRWVGAGDALSGEMCQWWLPIWIRRPDNSCLWRGCTPVSAEPSDGWHVMTVAFWSPGRVAWRWPRIWAPGHGITGSWGTQLMGWVLEQVLHWIWGSIQVLSLRLDPERGYESTLDPRPLSLDPGPLYFHMPLPFVV